MTTWEKQIPTVEPHEVDEQKLAAFLQKEKLAWVYSSEKITEAAWLARALCKYVSMYKRSINHGK